MKHLHKLIAILICVLGGTARLDAADAEPPLCIVLFRVTLDAEAKVQDLQTLKVIDMLSASRIALPVELPQAFLDNARKQVESQGLKWAGQKGQASSTMTTLMHAPAPPGATVPPISFAALDGTMNTTSNLRLLGRDGQMSSFGKNLGSAAFFVMYYALPEQPKHTKAEREVLIDAEIQRNLANVQNAEILSQKDLSDDAQTIMEITARSPRNKAMTIRSRYLCNDQKMVALVAITPEGLPAADIESFERLFTAFRFR